MSGFSKHTNLDGTITYRIGGLEVTKEEWDTAQEMTYPIYTPPTGTPFTFTPKTSGGATINNTPLGNIVDYTIPNGDDQYTPKMSYYTFTNELSKLKGRMLTLLEAMLTDPVQRKAAKDLVKTLFIEQKNNAKDYYFQLDKLIEADGEQDTL